MELIETAVKCWDYYLILVIVATLYGFALWGTLYSLFDPAIELVLNLIFSGTLVLWFWANRLIADQYALSYVLCSAGLLAGYRLTVSLLRLWQQRRASSWRRKELGQFIAAGRKLAQGTKEHQAARRLLDYRAEEVLNYRHLTVLATLLMIVTAAALIYQSQTSGLAIFSDNPWLDRVSLNASSRWLSMLFAACNRVGFILGVILFFSPSLPGVPPKWYSATIIALFVMSCAAGGSKAALLTLVFAFGIIPMYVRCFSDQLTQVWGKRVQLAAVGIIPLGLFYCVYIIVSSELGEDITWVFMHRVAMSGETYIYFFFERQVEALQYTYQASDYLLHTFTAAFGIKLIPYNIGVALYGGSTGDYATGVGPNPQHAVEGIVFFGLYWAPLYSAAIGIVFGLSRELLRDSRSTFGFVLFLILCLNASALPIDVNLWIFNTAASVLFVMGLYLVVAVLTPSPKRRRAVSNPELTSIIEILSQSKPVETKGNVPRSPSLVPYPRISPLKKAAS